jgi:ferredoxin-nitrite reductase
MLRVRLDGGRVEKSKFTKLIYLAKQENLKLLITARAGLELHYIKPSKILDIYYRVKELGLTTHQSLTDNVRAITLDPYDNIAKDSKIDGFNILEQIRDELIDNPKYFGMVPRKFNTTIIGRVTPLINIWGNDLVFALAKSGNLYGFNVYIGGKNSEVAKDIDIFIEPKDTKRLFFAILDTFLEHGFRGSRSKVRIFYLLEEIGANKLRELIEKKYQAKLQTKGQLLMQSSKYQISTELKDNTFAKVLNCNNGEINLDKALTYLKEFSNIRVGVDQNLHIIGVKVKEDIKTSSIIACAGARYCPLALWDIKQDIKELELEEFQKEGINIGFSGCLKGCGRHHHNHIGLVGLRSNMFGETQKAIRVFIGSSELPNPTPARLLFYAVPMNRAKELFKTIINEYKLGDYRDFNEFNNHLNQFSIELLQLWFILRQLTKLNSNLIELFHSKNSETKLFKEIKKLEIYPKKEELFDNINILSHQLWDN